AYDDGDIWPTFPTSIDVDDKYVLNCITSTDNDNMCRLNVVVMQKYIYFLINIDRRRGTSADVAESRIAAGMGHTNLHQQIPGDARSLLHQPLGQLDSGLLAVLSQLPQDGLDLLHVDTDDVQDVGVVVAVLQPLQNLHQQIPGDTRSLLQQSLGQLDSSLLAVLSQLPQDGLDLLHVDTDDVQDILGDARSLLQQPLGQLDSSLLAVLSQLPQDGLDLLDVDTDDVQDVGVVVAVLQPLEDTDEDVLQSSLGLLQQSFGQLDSSLLAVLSQLPQDSLDLLDVDTDDVQDIGGPLTLQDLEHLDEDVLQGSLSVLQHPLGQLDSGVHTVLSELPQDGLDLFDVDADQIKNERALIFDNARSLLDHLLGQLNSGLLAVLSQLPQDSLDLLDVNTDDVQDVGVVVAVLQPLEYPNEDVLQSTFDDLLQQLLGQLDSGLLAVLSQLPQDGLDLLDVDTDDVQDVGGPLTLQDLEHLDEDVLKSSLGFLQHPLGQLDSGLLAVLSELPQDGLDLLHVDADQVQDESVVVAVLQPLQNLHQQIPGDARSLLQQSLGQLDSGLLAVLSQLPQDGLDLLHVDTDDVQDVGVVVAVLQPLQNLHQQILGDARCLLQQSLGQLDSGLLAVLSQLPQDGLDLLHVDTDDVQDIGGPLTLQNFEDLDEDVLQGSLSVLQHPLGQLDSGVHTVLSELPQDGLDLLDVNADQVENECVVIAVLQPLEDTDEDVLQSSLGLLQQPLGQLDSGLLAVLSQLPQDGLDLLDVDTDDVQDVGGPLTLQDLEHLDEDVLQSSLSVLQHLFGQLDSGLLSVLSELPQDGLDLLHVDADQVQDESVVVAILGNARSLLHQPLGQLDSGLLAVLSQLPQDGLDLLHVDTDDVQDVGVVVAVLQPLQNLYQQILGDARSLLQQPLGQLDSGLLAVLSQLPQDGLDLLHVDTDDVQDVGGLLTLQNFEDLDEDVLQGSLSVFQHPLGQLDSGVHTVLSELPQDSLDFLHVDADQIQDEGVILQFTLRYLLQRSGLGKGECQRGESYQIKIGIRRVRLLLLRLLQLTACRDACNCMRSRRRFDRTAALSCQPVSKLTPLAARTPYALEISCDLSLSRTMDSALLPAPRPRSAFGAFNQARALLGLNRRDVREVTMAWPFLPGIATSRDALFTSPVSRIRSTSSARESLPARPLPKGYRAIDHQPPGLSREGPRCVDRHHRSPCVSPCVDLPNLHQQIPGNARSLLHQPLGQLDSSLLAVLSQLPQDSLDLLHVDTDDVQDVGIAVLQPLKDLDEDVPQFSFGILQELFSQPDGGLLSGVSQLPQDSLDLINVNIDVVQDVGVVVAVLQPLEDTDEDVLQSSLGLLQQSLGQLDSGLLAVLSQLPQDGLDLLDVDTDDVQDVGGPLTLQDLEHLDEDVLKSSLGFLQHPLGQLDSGLLAVLSELPQDSLDLLHVDADQVQDESVVVAIPGDARSLLQQSLGQLDSGLLAVLSQLPQDSLDLLEVDTDDVQDVGVVVAVLQPLQNLHQQILGDARSFLQQSLGQLDSGLLAVLSQLSQDSLDLLHVDANDVQDVGGPLTLQDLEHLDEDVLQSSLSVLQHPLGQLDSGVHTVLSELPQDGLDLLDVNADQVENERVVIAVLQPLEDTDEDVLQSSLGLLQQSLGQLDSGLLAVLSQLPQDGLDLLDVDTDDVQDIGRPLTLQDLEHLDEDVLKSSLGFLQHPLGQLDSGLLAVLSELPQDSLDLLHVDADQVQDESVVVAILGNARSLLHQPLGQLDSGLLAVLSQLPQDSLDLLHVDTDDVQDVGVVVAVLQPLQNLYQQILGDARSLLHQPLGQLDSGLLAVLSQLPQDGLDLLHVDTDDVQDVGGLLTLQNFEDLDEDVLQGSLSVFQHPLGQLDSGVHTVLSELPQDSLDLLHVDADQIQDEGVILQFTLRYLLQRSGLGKGECQRGESYLERPHSNSEQPRDAHDNKYKKIMSDHSSASSDFSETHPSTTTISTVAVQAGPARIVLAVLRCGEWIRVRIQQMDPDLYDIGASLEEAMEMQRVHEQLRYKLQAKQSQISELLARADDLVAQQRTRTEVYEAMAQSLGKAWQDLQSIMERRSDLLAHAVLFFTHVSQYSNQFDLITDLCRHFDAPHDGQTVERLLHEHHEMKQKLLEQSKVTLEVGHQLLDHLRRLSCATQSEQRQSVLTACNRVERILESLTERRRGLDELWRGRKHRLEEATRLTSLDDELQRLLRSLARGDYLVSNCEIGRSLQESEMLMKEVLAFGNEAGDVQDALLRLCRSATSLMEPGGFADTDSIRRRLEKADRVAEEFIQRLETRRRLLNMAVIFYSEVEVLFQRARRLDIAPNESLHEVEARLPGLRTTGQALLAKLEPDSHSAHAVRSKLKEAEDFLDKCYQLVRRHEQEDEKRTCTSRLEILNTWMVEIVFRRLREGNDPGTTVASVQNFIDAHQHLLEELSRREGEFHQVEILIEPLHDKRAFLRRLQELRQKLGHAKTICHFRLDVGHRLLALLRQAQQDELSIQVFLSGLDEARTRADLLTDYWFTDSARQQNMLVSQLYDQQASIREILKKISASRTAEDDDFSAGPLSRYLESQLARIDAHLSALHEQWNSAQRLREEVGIYKQQLREFNSDARRAEDMMRDAEAKFTSTVHFRDFLDFDQFLAEHNRSRDVVNQFVNLTLTKGRDLLHMLSTRSEDSGAAKETRSALSSLQAAKEQWDRVWQTSLSRAQDQLRSTEALGQIEYVEREVDQAVLELRRARDAMQTEPSEKTRDSLQLLENRVPYLKDQVRASTERSESQVTMERANQLKKKWSHFLIDLQEFRTQVDLNLSFRDSSKKVETHISELWFFLKSKRQQLDQSQDPIVFDRIEKELQDRLNTVPQEIDQELRNLSELSFQLYGSAGPQRVHPLTVKAQDSIGALKSLDDECVQKNEHRRQSQGPLQAPVITQPLRNIQVEEGCPVTLEVAYKEDSRCQTASPQWFKDGITVDSPDYKTRAYPGHATLTIDETFADDSAKYTCKVSNPAGADETSAYLSVVETHRTLEPPDFTKQLRSVDVLEGEPLTLECHVIGEPFPKVRWFRNDINLDASPEYVITLINGVCTLKARSMQTIHAGRYLCKATSSAGSASTTCLVGIKQLQRPVILQQLPSTAVDVGVPVRLETKFEAMPPPEVSWLKDGVPVFDSPGRKINIGANATSLSIDRAEPRDQGRYSVSVRNPAGQAQTSGTLNVSGPEDLHRPSQMKRQAQPQLDDWQQPKLAKKQNSKPVFVSPLKDVTVPEGAPVRLDCSVTGVPDPSVEWFKSGRSIMESSDYKFSIEGDKVVLTIPEAFSNDTAEYMIRAFNDFGSAESRCKGSATDHNESAPVDESVAPTRAKKPQRELRMPRDEGAPPEFVRKLAGQNCSEGEPLEMSVQITGSPVPQVVWFKDGKKIEPSPDFILGNDGETSFMKIPEVFQEDSGRYEVVATNPHGTAKSGANLRVRPLSTEGIKISPQMYVNQSAQQPPEFTKLFRDQTAKTSEPITISCEVTGIPEPIVRWTFNGQPVKPSQARITVQGNKHSLSIPSIDSSHAGRYAATAENPHGRATCAALLVVEDAKENRYFPRTTYETATHVISKKYSASAEHLQQMRVVPAIPWRPASPRSHSSYYKTELTGSTFAPVDLTFSMPIPPEFIQPIKSVTAKEGARVEFDGFLVGKPEPTVRWFRGGRELHDSPDFEIKFKDGRVTLSIPEAFPEDQGTYTCEASNKGGQTSSSAELVIRARTLAPVFLKGLESQQVFEGQPVHFVVKVGGDDSTRVSWYRDGSKIESSPDFTIEQIGDLHTLKIPECFTEDSGRYTVTATNESGEVVSSATLTVKEVTGTAEGPPVTKRKKTTGLEYQYQTDHPQYPVAPKVAEESVSIATIQPAAQRPQQLPPRFTQRLMPAYSANEGDKLTLNVQFEGKPAPSVSWFKNGAAILESSDYTVVTSEFESRLTIPEVFPEDSGSYACSVENPAGSDACESSLAVQPKPPSQEPPTFVRPLRPAHLHTGERANFQVEFTGKPRPSVEWYLSGRQLHNSPACQIGVVGQKSTLEIPRIDESFAGLLECILHNPAGSRSTEAPITVEPSEIPAKFTQRLAPEYSKLEGDSLRMTVRFTGDPAPSISWFKDGQPLESSPDIQVQIGRGESSIFIPEAFAEDSGEFSCTVENSTGRETCVAELNVLDAARPDETAPAEEQPRFTKKLFPISVDEGQRAVFEVTVAGNPAPTVAWYKDGVRVSSSSDADGRRIQVSQTGGTATLVISSAVESDSGVVACVAENPLGRETTDVSLRVNPAMRPPRFLGGLEPQLSANTGEDVVLSVRFDGRPVPRVTWLRNGAPIPEGPHARMEEFGNQATIMLTACQPEQSGLIACVLHNPAGTERCESLLTVKPKQVVPTFKRRLQPVSVKEGEKAIFIVEVAGEPKPEVLWKRENLPIESSTDFQIAAVGTVHSLTIPECFPEDAGLFACQIKNAAGSDSCTAHLTVEPKPEMKQQKPQLLKPPRNVTVDEGQPAAFVAEFSGTPEPQAVWLREGAPIEASPDFLIEAPRPGCSVLRIPECFSEDAGAFQLALQNSEGRTVCDVTLTVLAKAPTPPPAPPPPPPPPQQPILPAGAAKPQFERPARNACLMEGQPTQLDARVFGRPAPSVRWLKNGHPVRDSSRVQSSYNADTGEAVIYISMCLPEDAGTYACQAINPAGTESCTAQLLEPASYHAWLQTEQARQAKEAEVAQKRSLVSELESRFTAPPAARRRSSQASADEPDTGAVSAPFNLSSFERSLLSGPAWTDDQDQQLRPSARMVKPTFVERLLDQRLKENTETVFYCRVWGDPMPRVKWFWNGKVVKRNEHVWFGLDEYGIAQLRIQSTRHQDRGFYTACAYNPVGRDVSSAQLSVETTGEIVLDSYVSEDTLKELARLRREKKKDYGESGIDEKLYRPHFKSVPSDCEAREGAVLRLDSIVSGRPIPEMLWFRDSVKVNEDDLHKIVINEEGIHSLIFNSLVAADSGEYLCIARNRAGEDRFQVCVNVKPREHASVPRFVQKISTLTVNEGEPVEFHCAVEGAPQPLLSWQKDGRMINPEQCERYQIAVVGLTTSLTIPIVELSDAAWFQCTAANIAGTACSRAKLNVLPVLKAPEPERKLVITKASSTPRRPEPEQQPEWISTRRIDATMESQPPAETENYAPTFTKKPAQIKVAQGGTAKFMTRVAGNPMPEVTWILNGNQIETTSRFRVWFDGMMHNLEVSRAEPEDTGVVEVVAINDLGEVRCSTALTVEPAADWRSQLKPLQDEYRTKTHNMYRQTTSGLRRRRGNPSDGVSSGIFPDSGLLSGICCCCPEGVVPASGQVQPLAGPVGQAAGGVAAQAGHKQGQQANAAPGLQPVQQTRPGVTVVFVVFFVVVVGFVAVDSRVGGVTDFAVVVILAAAVGLRVALPGRPAATNQQLAGVDVVTLAVRAAVVGHPVGQRQAGQALDADPEPVGRLRTGTFQVAPIVVEAQAVATHLLVNAASSAGGACGGGSAFRRSAAEELLPEAEPRDGAGRAPIFSRLLQPVRVHELQPG
uniref:Fibrillar collagen NC1 domain-containing protein n=1 Tax=Macrostomum lignano TaxID=282301 RepID=A0A1I8GUQ1_9PLAT